MKNRHDQERNQKIIDEWLEAGHAPDQVERAIKAGILDSKYPPSLLKFMANDFSLEGTRFETKGAIGRAVAREKESSKRNAEAQEKPNMPQTKAISAEDWSEKAKKIEEIISNRYHKIEHQGVTYWIWRDFGNDCYIALSGTSPHETTNDETFETQINRKTLREKWSFRGKSRTIDERDKEMVHAIFELLLKNAET